jgi:saccharopine dehydrogenase-like NADP-dependent oxidoreductase
MGRVIVSDLATSPGVERVTVADVDQERAGEVAGQVAGLGTPADVAGVGADVSSPDFLEVLRGHDVCVASVAYRLNRTIAEACVVARCHYVDLGGLFHMTRKVLELDGSFREAGLTGVTGMGGSPGITNMLAVMAARGLDEVREIHVRLGSVDPSVRGLPLPIPYSLETLLDEFTRPAMAYREGGFVEVPPLGEPEDVDYPAPIGARPSFTTLHSEVATLPGSFPGTRAVTFKIALEQELIERFQLLAAVGLASAEPIAVGGAEVRPRDVLAALGRGLPQGAGTGDTECLRVVMIGAKDGSPATVVAESVIEPDAASQMGGGARDTGIPPSIAAQMIVAGEVRGPGMSAPEMAVDADRFFERLAERGITYSVSKVAG